MTLSARARLTWWYGASLVSVVVIAGLFVWSQYSDDVRASFTQQLQTHARDLRDAVQRGEVGMVGVVDPLLPGMFGTLLGPTGEVVERGPTAPALHSAPAQGVSTARPDPAGPEYLLVREALPDGRSIVTGIALTAAQIAEHQLSQLLLLGGAIGGIAAVVAGWWLAGRAVARRASVLVPARDDPPGPTELQRRHDHDYIAGASHDLRNPIAAIRLRLEVADRPTSTPDQLRAAVHEGLYDTVRLAEFADGLLRLAETEDSTGPSEPAPIGEVVAGVLRDVDVIAAPRGVRIEARLDDGDALVDGVRAHQILANLVGNAVRHGPPDSVVEVSVRAQPGPRMAGDGGAAPDAAAPADRARRGLRIEVADRGPGIDPRRREDLFTPFGAGHHRSGDSHGLGLATAAAAARAAGGAIGFDDRPGGGTTFWCWLPVMPSDAPETATPTAHHLLPTVPDRETAGID